MLINRDYLLKKSAGPSAPKFFLDTRIVPLAANLAGGVEIGLDRLATRLHVRPVAIVAATAGGAALMVYGWLRHSRA